MQDLKVIGLKFHDCHVLMQDILPVSIRGILPKNVRQVIILLCILFVAWLNYSGFWEGWM